MPSPLTIALLALSLSLVVGVLLPRWTAPGRLLRGIASRHALANAIVAAVAFATAWSIAWHRPNPPNFHDEFSLLLMADTFASGRLSNPTPPLPEHFEAPHILLEPTYASKYPVVQGMVLAAGQILGGDPALGLQLGFAAACFLCCWMLQGWLPARWGFVGALLWAAHPAILFRPSESWVLNYWSGALTAGGSALVYGAIGRLRFAPAKLTFVWLGLGLIVLANSRPFEGLAASLPAAVVFLRWFMRQVREVGRSRSLLRISSLFVVLASGIAAMGIYFKAVTGNPLRMPYFVHDARYSIAPSFWFQQMKPTPSTYFLSDGSLNPMLERRYRFHHTYEKKCREDYDGLDNLLGSLGDKWLILGGYYVLSLAAILTGVFWMFRSRRTWLHFAVVLSVFMATMLTTWTNPHYVAPMAPSLMFLAVQGMRVWLIARPLTRWTSAAILAVALVVWVGLLIHEATKQEFAYSDLNWQVGRAAILKEFEQKEGKHLILVQYEPGYTVNIEYVYNRADIPNAKVVWAQSLGPAADRELCRQFSDRQIWLLPIRAEDDYRRRPVPAPYEFVNESGRP